MRRRAALLWWLHSLYALALGIGVMWLGAHNYAYLRVTVFHLSFIWTTSIVAPLLIDLDARAGSGGFGFELPSRWRRPVRLAVNYFNKNFYQQLLFFLLPIYYASATAWSDNMFFVAFLAVSALISTLDVFYDRHLSVRRGLAAMFFAFNLFACVNVMLPVVWHISNTTALRASAAIALVAFLSICYRVTDLRQPRAWVVAAASAGLMLATVVGGSRFVPPAPLRLLTGQFAGSIDRRTARAAPPVTSVDGGSSGWLYAVTAIEAPLGLEERVAHRWYRNDEPVFVSAAYGVRGGRREGFRLWTGHYVRASPGASLIRVDVVTAGGQLVGRVAIPVRGKSGL